MTSSAPFCSTSHPHPREQGIPRYTSVRADILDPDPLRSLQGDAEGTGHNGSTKHRTSGVEEVVKEHVLDRIFMEVSKQVGLSNTVFNIDHNGFWILQSNIYTALQVAEPIVCNHTY